MTDLTEWELGVLTQFAKLHLGGAESWEDQLRSLRVVSRDISHDSGYISFTQTMADRRPITNRYKGPYDLAATDNDGTPIVCLLFLADDEFAALEYYRADGETIQQLPSPETLD